MNITVYGTNADISYIVGQLASKEGFSYEIEPDLDLDDLKESLIETNDDAVIIDYSSYNEYEEEDFVSAIYDICNSRKLNIIFFMPGYDEDSKIVTSLNALGLDRIITEKNKYPVISNEVINYLNEPVKIIQSDESEKIIESREEQKEKIISENKGLKYQEEISNSIKDNEILRKADKVIKIAVCGVLPRIGTTRIAIQLCKTANYYNEGSAAYIEVSGNYLNNLCEYFETTKMNNAGILFENLSMYKAHELPSITKKGYSILVYDFGVLSYDNLTSILDKDVVVVVGMSGPSEIAAYTPAIKMTLDSSVVNYVFYDTPKNKEERNSLLDQMGRRKDSTIFIEHISDPYLLEMTNLDEYKKILETKQDVNVQDARKRKKLSRLYG